MGQLWCLTKPCFGHFIHKVSKVEFGRVRTTGLPIHFLHWIESCAESRVFSARNRMLTRVVAKQAKTTKVKNKFVSGKKKVQTNTQLSFWWKGKSSI